MVKRRKIDHQSGSDAPSASPQSAAAALRARRQQQNSQDSSSSNDASAQSSPAPEKPVAIASRQKKKSKPKTPSAADEKDAASKPASPKPLSAVKVRRKATEDKSNLPNVSAAKPVSAVEARRKALEAATKPVPGSNVEQSDHSLDDFEPDYVSRPDDGDDARFLSSTSLQPNDAVQNALYPPPIVELSSWTPECGNVLKNNASSMTARLASGETLANIGVYDILIKRGVITIYGAIVRAGPNAQPYRVFAPASHALPVIHCLSPDGAEVDLKSVTSELSHLEKLSPLHGRLWKGEDSLDSSFLKDHKKRWSFENIHRLSDDAMGRPLYHLEILPKWHQAIDKVCSATSKSRPDFYERVLVCGPKSTGKSTFSRMLLNRMFTIDREAMKTEEHSIFLLDLDPGQPEYSPPGQVSLIELRQPIFGPPFTHPSASTGSRQRTIRAHFIGGSSPKDNPEHLIECAVDLMNHYQKHLSFGNTCGPIIINSPGWIIGTGLQILTDLIARLDLTDVVYMTDEPGRSLDALRQATSSASVNRFHIIPSQPSGTLPARSAAEFRDMQMLSYFHLAAPTQGSPHQSWDPTPLTGRAPYILSYAGADPSDRDFLTIMLLGEALPATSLATVLNGAIVGIAQLSSAAGDALTYLSTHTENRDSGPLARTPTEHLPYLSAGRNGHIEPLPPQVSQLVSLGLVRDIEVKRKALHVLVPPASEHLIAELAPERTILVVGAMDTPGWAYLEDVHLAAHRRAAKQKGRGAEAEADSEVDVDVSGIPWVQESGEGEVMGRKRRLRRFVN